MNGLSAAARGVGVALSATTDLVAAGGPTLNLKMTSVKTAPARSPAQSTSPNQPAAVSAKKKKNKKDTLREARETYESSKRTFLESQKLYLELERRDKIAKDQFNEIQLQLQQLCREDVSIVRLLFLRLPSFLSTVFPFLFSHPCPPLKLTLCLSIPLISLLMLRIRQKWVLIWSAEYRNKPCRFSPSASITSQNSKITSSTCVDSSPKSMDTSLPLTLPMLPTFLTVPTGLLNSPPHHMSGRHMKEGKGTTLRCVFPSCPALPWLLWATSRHWCTNVTTRMSSKYSCLHCVLRRSGMMRTASVAATLERASSPQRTSKSRRNIFGPASPKSTDSCCKVLKTTG